MTNLCVFLGGIQAFLDGKGKAWFLLLGLLTLPWHNKLTSGFATEYRKNQQTGFLNERNQNVRQVMATLSVLFQLLACIYCFVYLNSNKWDLQTDSASAVLQQWLLTFVFGYLILNVGYNMIATYYCYLDAEYIYKKARGGNQALLCESAQTSWLYVFVSWEATELCLDALTIVSYQQA